MATRIRLHLDEHVDPALAHALHRRRVDVTTTAEAGLRGASDRVQLAFAEVEGRVIVTNDSDFLRLHRAGISHAGIAFYGPKRRSIGSLVRAVMMLWETRGASEMRNQVHFL